MLIEIVQKILFINFFKNFVCTHEINILWKWLRAVTTVLIFWKQFGLLLNIMSIVVQNKFLWHFFYSSNLIVRKCQGIQTDSYFYLYQDHLYLYLDSFYNYIFVAIYYFAKCYTYLLFFWGGLYAKSINHFLLDTVSSKKVVSESFDSKFTSLFVIKPSLIKTILHLPWLSLSLR